jgi:uncharacterized protein (TIGR03437 family)
MRQRSKRVPRILTALVFLLASPVFGAATCVPSKLVVAFTNALSTNVIGFPIEIGVRVTDDCGNYISQGSVVATFSNGNPAIAFTSIGNGLWEATYLISSGSGSITVTVQAKTIAPPLVGTVSVTITPNQSPNFALIGTNNIPPAVAGGEPVHQKITITSSNGQVPFQVTLAIAGGQTDILSVEPSSGVTPATVDLVVAPPVDLPGNILIEAVLEINSVYFSLPFMLTVVGPPSPALSIPEDRLLFSYVGSKVPRPQPLTVGNVSGLPLSFSVTTTTSSGGSWLSTATTGGVTTYRQPVSLSITANPAGLPSGTYSGVVHVSAGDGTSKSVPVTMTITDAQPSILLSQFGLTFNAIENGAAGPSQTFSILNGGQGTLNWSASVRNVPSWLEVSPASGQSIAGSETNPQVAVTADATNLSAGNYYALIKVDSGGADNAPQYVTVVLNVSPNTGQPVIAISPSGAIATAQVGSTSVILPSIYVYDLSGHPVSFTSGAATFDSGNWLFYSPSIVSGLSSPVRIDPVADSRKLVAGVHRGAITLQFADGSTSVVSVLLQMTPPLHRLRPRGERALTESVKTQPLDESDCVANSVTIQYTAASGYQVAAGWPATLIVQAIDNCSQPFSTGSIVASFSTGEPPISLQYVQNGAWSQSWTPNPGSAASVQVSFQATDPSRGLNGTLPYQVVLPITTYDPPILDQSGIVDPVSTLQGGPLGPGSLLVASGQRLSSSTMSASAPYPPALGDTLVIIGNEQIPLDSASEDELQGMLPLDLPVNASLPVIVSRGSTYSTPVLLTVATAAPSIYSADGSGAGQGVVYHNAPAGVLADSANPATAGELLNIQCAGLGAVTPAVAAGTVAPTGVSVNGDVNVTVGGIPASVVSAQMTQGTVGIYTVQITVPGGLTAGNAIPVQVSIAERVSNQVTIALQ